jgi:hypothetical protein
MINTEGGPLELRRGTHRGVAEMLGLALSLTACNMVDTIQPTYPNPNIQSGQFLVGRGGVRAWPDPAFPDRWQIASVPA